MGTGVLNCQFNWWARWIPSHVEEAMWNRSQIKYNNRGIWNESAYTLIRRSQMMISSLMGLKNAIYKWRWQVSKYGERKKFKTLFKEVTVSISLLLEHTEYRERTTLHLAHIIWNVRLLISCALCHHNKIEGVHNAYCTVISLQSKLSNGFYHLRKIKCMA